MPPLPFGAVSMPQGRRTSLHTMLKFKEMVDGLSREHDCLCRQFHHVEQENALLRFKLVGLGCDMSSFVDTWQYEVPVESSMFQTQCLHEDITLSRRSGGSTAPCVSVESGGSTSPSAPQPSPDFEPAMVPDHTSSQHTAPRENNDCQDSDSDAENWQSRLTFQDQHQDLLREAATSHFGANAKESYAHDLEHRGSGECEELPKLKEDNSFSAVFSNDVDLGREIYDVEDHYHAAGCGQAFARSSNFAAFSSGMIIFNGIYLGIDSDYNDASNLYDASWPFLIFEQLFCAFFTFELVVRGCAFRSLGKICADGWMRFDSFLVATMVLETWILMPLMKGFAGDSSVSLPMGPLRLLRLMKLTRMARMMRAFPELITLVKGMVRSVRAISGCVILVTIILYVFAIFLHMLMKEEDALNHTLWKNLQVDFKTMSHCMWTLAVTGVMLDGFAAVSTYLIFDNKANTLIAGVAFVLFAFIAALTIMNMLIGVLCEVIQETTKERDAARDIAVMKSQILERLKKFDDGDGLITQQELGQIMQDPQSKSILRSLNINQLFLLQVLKLMFPRSDSKVAMIPLTEAMLMCRGDNQATVETLAGGFYYLVGELQESQAATKACLASISDELRHNRAAARRSMRLNKAQ